MTLSEDRKVVLPELVEVFTPNKLLQELEIQFNRPFCFLVNGVAVSRKEWDIYILRPGDVCHFLELPPMPEGGGGGGSNPLRILAMVAVIAIAAFSGQFWSMGQMIFGIKASSLVSGLVFGLGMGLVNMLFQQKPVDPAIGNIGEVWSISSQSNRARLGQPFAENFGRLRWFPDVATMPYTQYAVVNNFAAHADQHMYFLGILGVGEYDVEQVLIDETNVDDMSEVSYNILPPGTYPTEFMPNLAWTCDNFNGQELNRAVGDWEPMIMTVNPAGTVISTIQFDVTYPAGCYWASGSGGLGGGDTGILIIAAVRLIDDDGTPLSDWTVLDIPRYYSHRRLVPIYGEVYNEETEEWETVIVGWTVKYFIANYDLPDAPDGFTTDDYYYLHGLTAQPLAGTFQATLPYGFGRYQFLIGGVDHMYGERKAVNKCYMGQVRGFGPPHSDSNYGSDFSGLTLLEMKIRASSNLSGRVADKINVIGTRKLYPVTDCEFSDTLTPTSSIVDAIAYIVTSENGGNQDPSFLNWADLYALRQELQASEYYFCHRFQTRSSVMEACATAARCGKAMPFVPGAFTVVQDRLQPTPTKKFTIDDYSEGTFSITHNFRSPDAPTCVEIHCIDSDTWSEAVINCYDENGSTQNPSVYELTGCASRQQGWEIGMWMYWVDSYLRSHVEFTTGLKGLVPLPGERVLVDVPTVDFQRSGKIMKIEYDSEDSSALVRIHLSEDVVFDSSGTGILYISGEAGEMRGPYTVYESSDSADDANVVIGDLPEDVFTVETHAEAGAKYIFAHTTTEVKSILVTKIIPAGVNSIRISGPFYDERVYGEPGAVAPALTMDLLQYLLLDYNGVVSYVDSGDSSGAAIEVAGELYVYKLVWNGTADMVKVEVDYGDDSSGIGFIEYDEFLESSSLLIETDSNDITVRVTPYSGDSSGSELATEYQMTKSIDAPPTPAGVAASGYTEIAVSWDLVSGQTDWIVLVYVDDSEVFSATISATDSYTISSDNVTLSGGPWSNYTVYVAALDSNGQRGIAGYDVVWGASD